MSMGLEVGEKRFQHMAGRCLYTCLPWSKSSSLCSCKSCKAYSRATTQAAQQAKEEERTKIIGLLTSVDACWTDEPLIQSVLRSVIYDLEHFEGSKDG